MGRPLLERSGKGVSPTVYGETVLEYAKMILKATATISSLAVPDMKNSIRISTYPSNMIARLLTDFYKEWGHVYSIEHHEGTVEDITEHDLNAYIEEARIKLHGIFNELESEAFNILSEYCRAEKTEYDSN